jgi:hypothetical protein
VTGTRDEFTLTYEVAVTVPGHLQADARFHAAMTDAVGRAARDLGTAVRANVCAGEHYALALASPGADEIDIRGEGDRNPCADISPATPGPDGPRGPNAAEPRG